MAYIGLEPQTSSFPIDQLAGDGSTAAFVMSYAPASKASILVMVDGVRMGVDGYNVSGTTLTFVTPPVGGAKIEVLHLGIRVEIGQPAAGTVGYNELSIPPGGYLLHVEDRKPSGTPGGGSVVGWQTRDLNTIITNEVGASLASNQITLPAGVYEIDASAPGYSITRHRLSLYNVTDSAHTMIGTSEVSISGAFVTSRSLLKGRLEMSAAKVFELRQYTELARSPSGLGEPLNISGQEEIYTQVMIRKIG